MQLGSLWNFKQEGIMDTSWLKSVPNILVIELEDYYINNNNNNIVY
jgi:hypothetical protein